MADCIFCSIAAGDVPSSRVYEDDRTFAFLDLNPLRRGHTLVIPKTHGEKLESLDPKDAAAVMATTARVTAALHDLTGDPDATIAINNGPAAGQEVPHLHVHIVPRAADDGFGPIHTLFPDRPDVSQSDRDVLAAQIRDALGIAD